MCTCHHDLGLLSDRHGHHLQAHCNCPAQHSLHLTPYSPPHELADDPFDLLAFDSEPDEDFMLHPPRRQRQQRGSSTNAGPSRLIPAGGAQKQQQRDLDGQQLVESLQVPLHAARQALEACYGDLNAAADSLLGVDAATPVVQQQAEQQQLRPQQVQQHQVQHQQVQQHQVQQQQMQQPGEEAPGPSRAGSRGRPAAAAASVPARAWRAPAAAAMPRAGTAAAAAAALVAAGAAPAQPAGGILSGRGFDPSTAWLLPQRMALALPPLAAGQGFEEANQLMVLIDSREKREINQLKASLQAQGMAAEARNLPVGDVLWVARAR